MNSQKHIWIVHPFEQLPNESDIPLRAWSLSKALVKKGYSVTWWASDFSHINKTKRSTSPDIDGFSIRLIETLPYKKNISLRRIRSNRSFCTNFYKEAINKLKNNILEKPFRIVISLPPLGLAENAFKIRDYINESIEKDNRDLKLVSKIFCQVIVDINDAWPEVYYRIFSKKIRKYIAPILLLPFHRSAMIAYKLADKISAVGLSYLKIAKNYLNTKNFFLFTVSIVKKKYKNQYLKKPMHLCYHGVDLKRFKSKIILNRSIKYNKLSKNIRLYQSRNIDFKNKKKVHLQIVYIGAMNSGYDLQTIISVAQKWKNKNNIPLQIHFAGMGDQLNSLKLMSKKLGLLESFDARNHESKVIFHGYLKNDNLKNLLISSDIALVANRTDTLVACPYKVAEYAGASLPMISCLDGEFNNLLKIWNAGLTYESGSIQSLYNGIKKYSKDFKLLKKHGLNARRMAKNIFDSEKIYKNYSKFIIDKT
jgi:glycosyltransferase involved in cell wall biosynthesis